MAPHALLSTDLPTSSGSGLADPVAAAFAATPRCDFLPPEQRRRAGHDGPLDIGHGQTCSQPRTVEAMLRLLDVRRGQQVLDVGSGSGWTTALLAHLVGPDGLVHAVELEPALAQRSAADVAAIGRWWVSVTTAVPGVLGLPDEAPYDRILVSADGGRVPHELVDQLADDGVLVAPVAGVLTRMRRHGRGLLRSEHGHYRFVPLR